MAVSLASLRKTAPNPNPFALIYGVEKVGKTALACEFPAPILMRTQGENPPAGVAVDSWEITTFADFDQGGEALYIEDHSFETLIVDSGDGLARMINAEACRRNGWNSVEDPGFGKGYVAADEIWNEVIGKLTALRNDRKMNIVLIAHAEIFRFDSPTSDPYSRYRPNLRKSTADMLQANADFIAFVNHRVSIKKEEVGFNKEVKRGEGAGLRIIYLDERPGFIAGNRYDMPSEVQFRKGQGYSELAKYIPKAA